MDLLGRKAKRRVESLEAQRDELLRTTYSQGSAIAELLSRVDSRESLIRDLLLEIDELNHQLGEALDRLSKPEPAPQPSFRPSEAYHMSEEEQELRWRQEQGLLKRGELEAALAQLDFDNTEIQLDPDYEPRPNLTY
jgi:hypothetical protein